MVRFFPDLIHPDPVVTEFYAEPIEGTIDRNIKKPLNPDHICFKRPNFGFNDELNFDEEFEANTNWRKFMDCVSQFPQYERVQNYIEFVRNKKMEKFYRSTNTSQERNVLQTKFDARGSQFVQNQHRHPPVKVKLTKGQIVIKVMKDDLQEI